MAPEGPLPLTLQFPLGRILTLSAGRLGLAPFSVSLLSDKTVKRG
jgi:hypothetical protein